MADKQQNKVPQETRRKRVSKKSKKSWRKHTDIQDVEEHLEEVRQDERTGGAAADKADKELFCVDNDTVQVTEKIKNQSSKQKKSLSSHKFLQIDTHVPAIIGRKRKKDKRIRKDSSSDEEEEEEPTVKKAVTVSKTDIAEPTNTDLWNEGAEKSKEEDNSFMSAARKLKVKKPSTVGRKTSGVTPIEVCHPGASYNPTFEDHQALLMDANDVEVKKLKERERINKELNFPSAEEIANNPTWVEEMSQGLFEEKEENEAESAEEEEEEMTSGLTQPVRAENRKTRTQKNKEKVLKEEREKNIAEKDSKKKISEVYRLRSLKKEIVQKEKMSDEKIRKKKEWELKNADKPKTLGRHKYEAPNLEIQLSDELTGNLRSLKPEGNVFEDRFKSLQKRNIIEPRKPVVPHRKYRLKTYTKRSYKRKSVKELNSKVLNDDS